MNFLTLLLIAVIAGVVLGSIFGYIMHGSPKKKEQKEKGEENITAESESVKEGTAKEVDQNEEAVEGESKDGTTESSAESISEYNEEREEDAEKGKERILEQLKKKGEITNDGAVELLDVSDSTAYRYLEELETEGKIKQIGETGRDVRYTLAE